MFKRFVILVATLFAASVVIFVFLELLPGDPAQILMGIEAPPQAVAALRVELGLDRPMLERYFRWIGQLLSGDLGNSYTYSVPVADLIAERLTVTLPLALIATSFSTIIGVAAGLYAASNHLQFGDYGVMAFNQLGMAVPNFWLGILLIFLFAILLGWVPAGGFPGWDAGLWPALEALLLPAIALAVSQAAILARMTRSSVLEVLHEDFVRTARAKGLTGRATLWGHVVRNALIPVVTIMGVELSNILVGTIAIEQVFSLPGMGRLVLQTILQLDLAVIKNVIMFLVLMVVAVNFVVDVLYAIIDPRLKARDL